MCHTFNFRFISSSIFDISLFASVGITLRMLGRFSLPVLIRMDAPEEIFALVGEGRMKSSWDHIRKERTDKAR